MNDMDDGTIENGARSGASAKRKLIAVSVLGIVIMCAAVFVYGNQPPHAFPENELIEIVPGMSAASVADYFKAVGIVRSADLFYLQLVGLHDPSAIKAGTYVFPEPLTSSELARRITEDNPAMVSITLTFPEGFRAEQYADIAGNELPNFGTETFLSNAREFEGFLYPDTYYVPPSITERELLELLRTTYDTRTEKLFSQASSTRDQYEVITIASILEREGKSPESMRRIAGIFENRLQVGMRLQADATIEYVLEKPISELTADDLDIDSPYNTYTNDGLPPTPIGNPGKTAITAALHPEETEYLYYITAPDGTFYYAETFDEHRANIQQYLR